MYVDDYEILQWLIKNGKIDIGKTIQEEAMKDKKQHLKNHKYAITQGKDGHFYTHYYGNDGKRHSINKKTREELEEALIKVYTELDSVTRFPEVFESWINEKLEFGEICEASYAKYTNDYNRFFKPDDPFLKIPIDLIGRKELELFIKRSIQTHELTTKTYAGLRTILMGPLKQAVRDGLTDFNVKEFFDMLVIPNRIFKKKPKKKALEEVFLPKEAEKLISYFWEQNDIRGLGLILMFQTGMRVGEMCALKWSDVSGNRISVERTETYVKDPETGKKVFKIGETGKTEKAERIIVLPEQCKKTISAIRKLNPFGEFMFMDKDNRRIVSKRFNIYLKSACRKIGIPERSTHKIRKTYASTLLKNKVDEALVADQLGHTNIATTRQYYYYNTADENAVQNVISEAISF